MASDEKILVEVAYALPERQVIESLKVKPGTTVSEAIVLSNILQTFPEIDLSTQKVGIFSKIVTMDTVLLENDRVEIYRPLQVDPKESRRLRAKKQNK